MHPNPRQQTPFDVDPQVYDQLVNWEKRLPRDEAFLRPRIEAVGAARVLDVACGTGRHAQRFSTWGLDVVGADVGPAMIDFCREQWGETDTLRWQVARMEALPPAERTFDTLLCLGNSMALLADHAAVAQTLAGFAAQLRPGGLLVTHVLNFHRLPDGPIVWQKARQVESGGRTWSLAKGVHRSGDQAFVDVATWPADATDDTSGCRSTPLLLLTASQIESALGAAGFNHVQHFGSQAGEPFDADASPDLITVATRGG